MTGHDERDLEQPVEMYQRHRHISPTTFLIFITLFVFSTFSLVNSVLRPHREDSSWDVLIFTQNWPVSVCEKWMHEGKDHICFKFPNGSWTIHGLWPTKKGMIGPNFCNASRPFSPEAIYGLEEQLLQYWSPVEKHKTRYMFWAHEWEKHGTCAAVLPQFSTEFDYFYRTLQLLKQYNMNDVLAKAGIASGQSYNVTKVFDGIRNVLGKNPQVFCYEQAGNSTLLEVRICLDKSLTLVDCDGTVVGTELGSGKQGYKNLTNCDIARPVRYPGKLNHTSRGLVANHVRSENPIFEHLKILNFARWFSG